MADAILESLRAQRLAELDSAIAAEEALGGEAGILRVQHLRRKRAYVVQPGWQPPRPSRRMPKLWVIASYWAEHGTFGEVYLSGAPYCFGCRKHVPVRRIVFKTPVERWNKSSLLLDRAHLVDRWNGGVDGPQNLVPLCYACHKLMPSFGPGEGQEAIAWVQAGGRWQRPEEVAVLERRFAAALRGDLDDPEDEPAVDDHGQFVLW